MKYIFAALLLLAAAGCVMTPQQIVEEGRRVTLRSVLDPQALAGCLIRNAEAKSGVIFGQARPGKTTGTTEVIIRAGGQGPDTLAVANIASVGTGAEATIWLSPNLFGERQFEQDLIAGC